MIYFVAEPNRSTCAVRPGRPSKQPLHRKRGTAVKIGWTSADSARDRLGSLQTGNPRQLFLLKEIGGSQGEERRLHQLLDGWKCGELVGEWFWFPPRAVNVVRWKRVVDPPSFVAALGAMYEIAWHERAGGGLPYTGIRGDAQRAARVTVDDLFLAAVSDVDDEEPPEPIGGLVPDPDKPDPFGGAGAMTVKGWEFRVEAAARLLHEGALAA